MQPQPAERSWQGVDVPAGPASGTSSTRGTCAWTGTRTARSRSTWGCGWSCSGWGQRNLGEHRRHYRSSGRQDRPFFVKYCSSWHNRVQTTQRSHDSPDSCAIIAGFNQMPRERDSPGTLKTIQVTPRFARAMLSLSWLPSNQEAEFEKEHVFAFAKSSSHLDCRQTVWL